MKKYTFLSLGFLLLSLCIFYRSFLFSGNVPIPTDSLVNLYHPFRDFFAPEYPRGVPFKNFLVGDPVIQQIPWKELSLSLISSGQLPLWNPYQMAGYPLLGNIQSSPVYPLNILMLLFPFITGWSLFIMLQQVLAAIFMYCFLRNRKLSYGASVLGSLSFSFSGFIISWLEWGNIIHTALWLPLALLAVDKIGEAKKYYWFILLSLAMACSYLGGHLQTFFYSFIVVILYALHRSKVEKFNFKLLLSMYGSILVGLLLLLPIWLPQLQFIGLSARAIDQDWHQPGFFIPLKHLAQFIAPNFFGNPATGNYWGEWNYGEFIGYIGIVPLLLSVTAIISKRSRDVYFWAIAALVAAVAAFHNPLALLPYQLSVPFLSSTQPTRAIFVVDVALVILAAYGFDEIVKIKKKIIKPQLILLAFLGLIAIGGYIALSNNGINAQQWQVALRNLVVPGVLVGVGSVGLFVATMMSGKKRQMILGGLILITLVDLLYFATKYTPFSSPTFYYPETKTLTYLQENTTNERILTTDRRILHPNISTMYRLQSLDGYDPLYLLRFGELMIATNRNKADISQPFGFRRIINPQYSQSPIINLLGVKYILSLTELSDASLEKVFEEGETKVYRNTAVFPRAFFVENIIASSSKQETLNILFAKEHNLRQTAVVENVTFSERSFSPGTASISNYTANRVTLTTTNEGVGFLLLSDSYYKTWDVFIDGKKDKIYLTNYHLRGVIVPKGLHNVEFKNNLL